MKSMAILAGLLLVLGATSRAGEEAGWYLFKLRAGDSLVARLVGEGEDSYTVFYQGSIIAIAKQDLKEVRPAAGLDGDSPEKSDGAPAPKDAAPPKKAAGGTSPQALRDAIEDLALLEGPRPEKAYLLLAANLADVRPLLHAAFRHPSAAVRGRVAKLLGEKGSAKEDLEAVSGRLSDPQSAVRLAAVMAVRALGPDGSSSLLCYLETETVAVNRKLAVKTLHLWKDRRAVKPLVARMEKEKDQGVLEFMDRALSDLTGQKLGPDPAAWKAWLDGVESRDEEERIVESRKAEVGRRK